MCACNCLWIYAEIYTSLTTTHDVAFLFIIDYVASVSSISGCEHWLVENQWGRVRQMPVTLIVTKQVKRKKERWIMNRTLHRTSKVRRERAREEIMFMKQLTHPKIQMNVALGGVRDVTSLFHSLRINIFPFFSLSCSIFPHLMFTVIPPNYDSQRAPWWGWAALSSSISDS